MIYTISGKNIDVTDSIASAIKKSLNKIEKFFKKPDDIYCRAVVRSYKVGAKIEVSIFIDGRIVRAEEYANDLYEAISLVSDKIQSQIKKLKRRTKNKDKSSLLIEDSIEKEPIKVVRYKEIEAKEMDVEDAIITMESLGHTFFMFIDEENKKPSLVYKRDDGDYATLVMSEQ